MIKCRLKDVIDERYACYKTYFDGNKDVEYCSEIDGMNIDGFFKCILD